MLAVVALGAWVYYRPGAQENQSVALSDLKPGEVRRIRLERAAAAPPAADPGQPSAAASPDQAHASTAATSIELERDERGWRMTAPFAARAETFQVDRLLAILDARSSARYPATDLARYGLDTPRAQVTLGDQTFGYGGINTMTREQYVLTRDAVYAIPLAQRTALPRDPDALISRSLFAPEDTPVRFEGAGLSASLQDGVWTFTPPPEDPGADEGNAWADAWRHATAVRASRHDGRVPESSVDVTLKDGRAIALGIVQREPELVLLRPDEGIQYHFFADTAKRLFSPPGVKK